jgi:hypothetical protein
VTRGAHAGLKRPSLDDLSFPLSHQEHRHSRLFGAGEDLGDGFAASISRVIWSATTRSIAFMSSSSLKRRAT